MGAVRGQRRAAERGCAKLLEARGWSLPEPLPAELLALGGLSGVLLEAVPPGANVRIVPGAGGVAALPSAAWSYALTLGLCEMLALEERPVMVLRREANGEEREEQAEQLRDDLLVFLQGRQRGHEDRVGLLLQVRTMLLLSWCCS